MNSSYNFVSTEHMIWYRTVPYIQKNHARKYFVSFSLSMTKKYEVMYGTGTADVKKHESHGTIFKLFIYFTFFSFNL